MVAIRRDMVFLLMKSMSKHATHLEQENNLLHKKVRGALNKLTLRSRSLAAAGCGLVGSGVFAAVTLTPVLSAVTHNMQAPMGLTVSGGLLFAVMAACWFSLSAAARMALQKRFPKIIIPRNQHIGKTGYTMLAVLLVVFAAMLMVSPAQPEWLQQLLGKPL